MSVKLRKEISDEAEGIVSEKLEVLASTQLNISSAVLKYLHCDKINDPGTLFMASLFSLSSEKEFSAFQEDPFFRAQKVIAGGGMSCTLILFLLINTSFAWYFLQEGRPKK